MIREAIECMAMRLEEVEEASATRVTSELAWEVRLKLHDGRVVTAKIDDVPLRHEQAEYALEILRRTCAPDPTPRSRLHRLLKLTA